MVMMHKKDQLILVEFGVVTFQVFCAWISKVNEKFLLSILCLLLLINFQTRALRIFQFLCTTFIFVQNLEIRHYVTEGTKGKDGTLKLQFLSLHRVRNLTYTEKEMSLRDEYSLDTWQVLWSECLITSKICCDILTPFFGHT